MPWTHRDVVGAPFAEFTWQTAREVLARRGGNDREQAEVALVLNELLHQAGSGPDADDSRLGSSSRTDRRARRQAARDRAGAPQPWPNQPTSPTDDGEAADVDLDEEPTEDKMDEVIPFGVFDASAEAERMW